MEMMRLGGCITRKSRTSDLDASPAGNGDARRSAGDKLSASVKATAQTSVASTVASSFASSSHRPSSLFPPLGPPAHLSSSYATIPASGRRDMMVDGR